MPTEIRGIFDEALNSGFRSGIIAEYMLKFQSKSRDTAHLLAIHSPYFSMSEGYIGLVFSSSVVRVLPPC